MRSLAFCALFSLPSISRVLAQTCIPPLIQNYESFHVLNCYIDDLQNRVLRNFVDASPNMTVGNCLDICLASEFALGGLENGDECYCGNALLYNPSPDFANNFACNHACTGSALEACGGPLRIEIYQNGNTPFTTGPAQFVNSYKDWNAFGCCQDSVTSRTLPVQLPISPLSMTVEQCLDGCGSANFKVAGLQFGEQCFCGNVTVPPGTPVNNQECNMPCTGNANEICGAPSLNWVYTRN